MREPPRPPTWSAVDGERAPVDVGDRVDLPLDGLTDAVVVLDRAWRYVYVNAKAGALFGRAPESLVGRHIWTEFPEGIGQPFHLAYERAMATRSEIRFEQYYAPWNRWFENHVLPTSSGLLIQFTETTDDRRARTALARSEQRFRALADATAASVWWMEADGAVSEPIPRFQAFTGRSFEEVRGFAWREAIHPDDWPLIRAAWAAARESRGVYVCEHRLRRHDGAWRLMHSRAVPLLGPDGAIREWVGSQVDVTDERATQAALATSEARFRSLSASSPLGVFELDLEGRALYVNPRLTEIWAMPEAELLGDGWVARVHPDDRLDVVESCRRATAAGEGHAREYRLALPGGAVRWVHARSAPLRDPRGAVVGAVGTVEDVTARRELEARLQQVQKLETAGQLAGGIAHDFNNLLTVIQGNLEFVTGDLPADHAAQADLAEIRAATDRTRALVRQLLAFSRSQVLAVRRLDLNTVVRDADRLLRRVIGEEIALQVAAAPEPLLVEADPGQLEQVLLNLALNARDAMLTPLHGHPGTGGALTVEADAVTLGEADAPAWSPLPAGRYARLTVRDTGHGMDAETASHVFEPFFTTKPVGEGTGLGLASVYGVVTQSGGAIRVQSAPVAGTTFVILLPRVEGSEAGAAPGPRRPDGVERRGRGTVLLVEDEGAVRAAARRLLERRGYAVLEARHGADALLVWREHRDAITAVITDVRMPELGGREFVAALRAEAPTLPVVYVSGYAGLAAAASLRSNEAFVEKPFTSEVLLGALARVLGDESR
jgi:two-component system, cell cycle sensor histidine kinase and response regulator CckA